MPWRSAEQLLAEDDDGVEGAAFGGRLFYNQSPRILKAPTSHGSADFAAVYRCQAPDPECQCVECWKARRRPKKTRERQFPPRRGLPRK